MFSMCRNSGVRENFKKRSVYSNHTMVKLSVILPISLLISTCYSHGSNENSQAKPDGVKWSDWHMKEEHDLDAYDSEYFFNLHDLKKKGKWDKSDILGIYGLTRENVVGDGSGMGEHAHQAEVITEDAKNHVVSTILSLIDSNNDGFIALDEWKSFCQSGKDLPDFGYGPGHHLDFEMEYEEHHWKKYHSKDDPDVLIKHAEDIEHELLHHEHGMEETHDLEPEIRKVAKGYLSHVKIVNIPKKYRSK